MILAACDKCRHPGKLRYSGKLGHGQPARLSANRSGLSGLPSVSKTMAPAAARACSEARKWWPHRSRSTGWDRPGTAGMITTTAGLAGQQQACSARPSEVRQSAGRPPAAGGSPPGEPVCLSSRVRNHPIPPGLPRAGARVRAVAPGLAGPKAPGQAGGAQRAVPGRAEGPGQAQGLPAKALARPRPQRKSPGPAEDPRAKVPGQAGPWLVSAGRADRLDELRHRLVGQLPRQVRLADHPD